jgi:hypothetical protein
MAGKIPPTVSATLCPSSEGPVKLPQIEEAKGDRGNNAPKDSTNAKNGKLGYNFPINRVDEEIWLHSQQIRPAIRGI